MCPRPTWLRIIKQIKWVYKILKYKICFHLSSLPSLFDSRLFDYSNTLNSHKVPMILISLILLITMSQLLTVNCSTSKFYDNIGCIGYILIYLLFLNSLWLWCTFGILMPQCFFIPHEKIINKFGAFSYQNFDINYEIKLL